MQSDSGAIHTNSSEVAFDKIVFWTSYFTFKDRDSSGLSCMHEFSLRRVGSLHIKAQMRHDSSLISVELRSTDKLKLATRSRHTQSVQKRAPSMSHATQSIYGWSLWGCWSEVIRTVAGSIVLSMATRTFEKPAHRAAKKVMSLSYQTHSLHANVATC